MILIFIKYCEKKFLFIVLLILIVVFHLITVIIAKHASYTVVKLYKFIYLLSYKLFLVTIFEFMCTYKHHMEDF